MIEIMTELDLFEQDTEIIENKNNLKIKINSSLV